MNDDQVGRWRAHFEDLAKQLMRFDNPEPQAKLIRSLVQLSLHVINEARYLQLELDSISAELSSYRPMRHEKPAAPIIPGHCYVQTAKAWTCIAVELREMIHINPGIGAGYVQEACVPSRKTICGMKTAFPIIERFTSGGWPRMHELCPDCLKLAVSSGKLTVEEIPK